MAKKPQPVSEAKSGYRKLQAGLKGEKAPKRELGSYDRKGAKIAGTTPKPAPAKPKAGGYDRRGKRISD